MPFVCPDCRALRLDIVKTLEMGPDASSDENDLQIVECKACGFEGAAEYRESRRGALDSESWHHDGFRVEAAGLAEIRAVMRREATPQFVDGRWTGVNGITTTTGWFALSGG